MTCQFNLAQALTALASNRLDDPNMQYWSSAELTLYIQEALREWNALTGYWRGDFTFSASQQPWYDLTDTVNLPNTLRPMTVTDQYLYQVIEAHLIEPPPVQLVNTVTTLAITSTGLFTPTVASVAGMSVGEFVTVDEGVNEERVEILAVQDFPVLSFSADFTKTHVSGVEVTSDFTWNGTTQFTLSDLVSAVQRGRDETLGVTGCFITKRSVAAALGIISLPSTVIDIRRNVYIDSSGGVHYLWKSDPQAWLGYEGNYTSNPPGTPRTYSTSAEPVWSFDVDVPPLPGDYELLTVETEAALDFSDPSLLYVPDDWSWVIKWRALADLMGKESEAKDVMRQQYCEMRYQQGLKLLALSPALLAMRINNQPVFIDSVKSADAYMLGWEGQTQGQPKYALTSGLNLIALNPPPDSGNYSITATVIQNAPVVALNSDCLNLSNDFVDVILDEAQHLAAFKMGGAEFQATIPLHERFIKQAAIYTSKVGQQGPFTRELWAMSQKQEVMEPRLKEDEEAKVG